MMYGIGLADHLALDNWRVMFLICGGGTVVAGILFIFLMPSGPETAWFLKPQERITVVRRLERDRISKDGTEFKMY